jgi:membrane protease YdiL (CAAX protease family)
VEAASARTWKKIGCFYALTMLFSGVCGGFVLHAGKMSAGNLLYVTGAMWSPALAVFATKKIFGESVRELPWRWGSARYAWLAYLIPILYTVPLYAIVWLSGLGSFNTSFLQETAVDFGWKNFPPSVTLTLFVLITATIGLIPKLSRALGEEIGWRGFLVPELAKVVRFPTVAVISGLMWAVYHYPVLLFADYNAGGPPWYGLTCFTLMVVAGSFIMAWLVLRARSLWPAAILHASHNLFIQSICTPLTRDTGPTKYIIDEFGIGLVVTTAIGAAIAYLAASRASGQTPDIGYQMEKTPNAQRPTLNETDGERDR